ncbi:Myb-like protein I [Porphyridium purpureum]|uniref:Myb-like protein I n=1 Tax=Porphyridium purpureum TaxID=35688 RepID=A0A5J4YV49_PORPP|nr:Myb-like protein I [Porphyridium purpureum]|eukprot:POR5283..scf227_4
MTECAGYAQEVAVLKRKNEALSVELGMVMDELLALKKKVRGLEGGQLMVEEDEDEVDAPPESGAGAALLLQVVQEHELHMTSMSQDASPCHSDKNVVSDSVGMSTPAAVPASQGAAAAEEDSDRSLGVSIASSDRMNVDVDVAASRASAGKRARGKRVSASPTSTPPLSSTAPMSPLVASTAGRKRGPSAKPAAPGQSRYWTADEHELFLEALKRYGHRDLRSISKFVGTRNVTQVRTHTQKYFMKLMRDAKRRQESESDGMLSPVLGPSLSTVTTPDALDLHAKSQASGEHHAQDVRSVPESCGVSLLSMVAQATT